MKKILKTKKFEVKIISIKIGAEKYDIHLNAFGVRFFAIGSVYHEVNPSVDLAKSALRKAAELCTKDKQKYQDALGEIAAITCHRRNWVDIAKVKKEYQLL